jgi:hypothetical protein
VLKVDPASSAKRGAGIGVLVVGVAAEVPIGVVTAGVVSFVVFGVILICPIATAFGAKFDKCVGGAAELVTPLYANTYVWVPAVAGAGLIGGAVVVLATVGSTQVVATPSSAPTPAAPNQAATTAYVREPTWAAVGLRRTWELPTNHVEVPLVRFSF